MPISKSREEIDAAHYRLTIFFLAQMSSYPMISPCKVRRSSLLFGAWPEETAVYADRIARPFVASFDQGGPNDARVEFMHLTMPVRRAFEQINDPRYLVGKHPSTPGSFVVLEKAAGEEHDDEELYTMHVVTSDGEEVPATTPSARVTGRTFQELGLINGVFLFSTATLLDLPAQASNYAVVRAQEQLEVQCCPCLQGTATASLTTPFWKCGSLVSGLVVVDGAQKYVAYTKKGHVAHGPAHELVGATSFEPIRSIGLVCDKFACSVAMLQRVVAPGTDPVSALARSHPMWVLGLEHWTRTTGGRAVPILTIQEDDDAGEMRLCLLPTVRLAHVCRSLPLSTNEDRIKALALLNHVLVHDQNKKASTFLNLDEQQQEIPVLHVKWTNAVGQAFDFVYHKTKIRDHAFQFACSTLPGPHHARKSKGFHVPLGFLWALRQHGLLEGSVEVQFPGHFSAGLKLNAPRGFQGVYVTAADMAEPLQHTNGSSIAPPELDHVYGVACTCMKNAPDVTLGQGKGVFFPLKVGRGRECPGLRLVEVTALTKMDLRSTLSDHRVQQAFGDIRGSDLSYESTKRRNVYLAIRFISADLLKEYVVRVLKSGALRVVKRARRTTSDRFEGGSEDLPLHSVTLQGLGLGDLRTRIVFCTAASPGGKITAFHTHTTGRTDGLDMPPRDFPLDEELEFCDDPGDVPVPLRQRGCKTSSSSSSAPARSRAASSSRAARAQEDPKEDHEDEDGSTVSGMSSDSAAAAKLMDYFGDEGSVGRKLAAAVLECSKLTDFRRGKDVVGHRPRRQVVHGNAMDESPQGLARKHCAVLARSLSKGFAPLLHVEKKFLEAPEWFIFVICHMFRILPLSADGVRSRIKVMVEAAAAAAALQDTSDLEWLWGKVSTHQWTKMEVLFVLLGGDKVVCSLCGWLGLETLPDNVYDTTFKPFLEAFDHDRHKPLYRATSHRKVIGAWAIYLELVSKVEGWQALIAETCAPLQGLIVSEPGASERVMAAIDNLRVIVEEIFLTYWPEAWNDGKDALAQMLRVRDLVEVANRGAVLWGKTGAGKSSMVNALLRLVNDPTSWSWPGPGSGSSDDGAQVGRALDAGLREVLCGFGVLQGGAAKEQEFVQRFQAMVDKRRPDLGSKALTLGTDQEPARLVESLDLMLSAILPQGNPNMTGSTTRTVIEVQAEGHFGHVTVHFHPLDRILASVSEEDAVQYKGPLEALAGKTMVLDLLSGIYTSTEDDGSAGGNGSSGWEKARGIVLVWLYLFNNVRVQTSNQETAFEYVFPFPQLFRGMVLHGVAPASVTDQIGTEDVNARYRPCEELYRTASFVMFIAKDMTGLQNYGASAYEMFPAFRDLVEAFLQLDEDEDVSRLDLTFRLHMLVNVQSADQHVQQNAGPRAWAQDDVMRENTAATVDAWKDMFVEAMVAKVQRQYDFDWTRRVPLLDFLKRSVVTADLMLVGSLPYVLHLLENGPLTAKQMRTLGASFQYMGTGSLVNMLWRDVPRVRTTHMERERRRALQLVASLQAKHDVVENVGNMHLSGPTQARLLKAGGKLGVLSKRDKSKSVKLMLEALWHTAEVQRGLVEAVQPVAEYLYGKGTAPKWGAARGARGASGVPGTMTSAPSLGTVAAGVLWGGYDSQRSLDFSDEMGRAYDQVAVHVDTLLRNWALVVATSDKFGKFQGAMEKSLEATSKELAAEICKLVELDPVARRGQYDPTESRRDIEVITRRVGMTLKAMAPSIMESVFVDEEAMLRIRTPHDPMAYNQSLWTELLKKSLESARRTYVAAARNGEGGPKDVQSVVKQMGSFLVTEVVARYRVVADKLANIGPHVLNTLKGGEAGASAGQDILQGMTNALALLAEGLKNTVQHDRAKCMDLVVPQSPSVSVIVRKVLRAPIVSMDQGPLALEEPAKRKRNGNGDDADDPDSTSQATGTWAQCAEILGMRKATAYPTSWDTVKPLCAEYFRTRVVPKGLPVQVTKHLDPLVTFTALHATALDGPDLQGPCMATIHELNCSLEDAVRAKLCMLAAMMPGCGKGQKISQSLGLGRHQSVVDYWAGQAGEEADQDRDADVALAFLGQVLGWRNSVLSTRSTGDEAEDEEEQEEQEEQEHRRSARKKRVVVTDLMSI